MPRSFAGARERVPQRGQVRVGDLGRQVQVHRHPSQRQPARRGVGGQDVHREPRGALPPVRGHHEDRIGREGHRDPVGDPHDAHVHAVARARRGHPGRVRPGVAGSPARTARPSPSRSAARSSALLPGRGCGPRRRATRGSPSPARWPPPRPRSRPRRPHRRAITSAAFVASMPPIPTTGSGLGVRHRRETVEPSRHRLGLRGGRPHGDAEVVGPRGRRGARLVGVAHADPEDAIGAERSRGPPRVRRPAPRERRPRRPPPQRRRGRSR